MGPPTITAIGALLGGLGAFVSAVGGFKAPKVEIPKVEIPQADLEKINQTIEENKSLSEAAKQTIQQAINLYNQGRLIPQYQATLDRWWDEASRNLNQRLAALGLSNSTIAQTAMNELSALYQQKYGELLTKQLSDALSLSGVSQQYYNQLMQKAQLQMQGKAAEAQSYAQAYGYAQQTAAQRGTAFGNLVSSVSEMTKGFGDVLEQLQKNKTQTNKETKEPEIAWV